MLGRSAALMSHRPRHSEVDQEYATGLEPNNQIFSAPLDGLDDLALELGCYLAWLDGAGHAGIADLDPVEAPADEDGLEASANRLDLGQLGHAASVAASRRAGPS